MPVRSTSVPAGVTTPAALVTFAFWVPGMPKLYTQLGLENDQPRPASYDCGVWQPVVLLWQAGHSAGAGWSVVMDGQVVAATEGKRRSIATSGHSNRRVTKAQTVAGLHAVGRVRRIPVTGSVGGGPSAFLFLYTQPYATHVPGIGDSVVPPLDWHMGSVRSRSTRLMAVVGSAALTHVLVVAKACL